jgi:putative ABC transport system substrate-binding protein
MKRREFITLFGSVAAMWPLAAMAQQPSGMRRIGFLTLGPEDNPAIQGLISVLRNGLNRLGWVEARNLHIDFRFGNGDAARTSALGAELVRSAPDVIVANYSAAAQAVQKQTKTVPIVIAGVGDPVESGLIKNIARPEGNVTGFTNLYASIGGKWLELLMEAAPHLSRVAILVNPQTSPGPTGVGSQFHPSIQAAAAARAVGIVTMPIRDAAELKSAIVSFAGEPGGGLIASPSGTVVAPRQLIALAAQYRLPSIYQSRNFAFEGGLMAYGSFAVEFYRGVASYLDRILHGAKVVDLPVQYPTKFDLTINLKTAKAIGLDVPATLLARADELIQ